MELKDRIKIIVEQSNIQKSEFAKRIGITPTYLSALLRGASTPSERLVNDFKREFNINPDWLTKEKGKMYIDITREKEITQFIAKVQKNKDSNIFNLIHALSKLDEDELEFLAKITLKLADKQKKDD